MRNRVSRFGIPAMRQPSPGRKWAAYWQLRAGRSTGLAAPLLALSTEPAASEARSGLPVGCD